MFFLASLPSLVDCLQVRPGVVRPAGDDVIFVGPLVKLEALHQRAVGLLVVLACQSYEAFAFSVAHAQGKVS